MDKITVLLSVVMLLINVIVIQCDDKYYSPDDNHPLNRKIIDPISYLLPFKNIGNDDEFQRLTKSAGSTGPIHTYIKTDKDANFKWGVRHYVGKKYKS
ncbi:unnamed protein product [Diamesa hyperborea]